MTRERRRYFRIDEAIGISYQVLDAPGDDSNTAPDSAANVLDMVAGHDERIQQLLVEVGRTHPQIAELVAVFNQKLERVVSQLVVDNRLVDRIAQRVKEANISACGIAFNNEESIPVGSRLELELSLFPGDIKLNIRGKVVGCSPSNEQAAYYWRIEFYDMNEATQEQLIQHIVKRQSAQLKKRL